MHTINSPELERIKSVTANYFFWQGLRWVPLGIVIIAFGFRQTPWWPLTGAWDDVFLFALVALGAVVSPFIGRYYRRTFGHVIDDAEAHHRREATKWFLVYPLMFFSLLIDMLYLPAFFVTGPVWAAGILAYWSSTGHGRPHYLLASSCMFLLGPVQWLEFVEPGKPMFAIFGLLLGAIYIVGGILDHRELCQILPPVKESEHGSAV
jgi:hypothetical protein